MSDNTCHVGVRELRRGGGTHHVEVGERHDGLELLALLAVDDALDDEIDEDGNVLLVELGEELLLRLAHAAVHPLLPERLEAQVLGVDVHHTAPEPDHTLHVHHTAPTPHQKHTSRPFI